MSDLAKNSLLQEGLVFRKRSVRRLFQGIDALYRLLRSAGPRQTCPRSPSRVLFSQLGGIGDALIAARVALAWREANPSSEIGLLLSSTTRKALESFLPFVARFHSLDHFYMGRTSAGLCKAALQHWKSSRIALQEVRSHAYEVAIDLQPFFPNALPFLQRAKIPFRLGYSTAGFGACLTHPFSWKGTTKYIGDVHKECLQSAGLSLAGMVRFPPPLSRRGLPRDHVLVHMCSSRREKNWNRASWITLVKALQAQGVPPLVLMGRGETDFEECRAVEQETGCLNLCNQLTILEYAFLLQGARLLISVDSFPLHLAALYDVPAVALVSGINPISFWIPPGQRVLLFSEPMGRLLKEIAPLARGPAVP